MTSRKQTDAESFGTALVFDIEGVRRCVRHASRCTRHTPAFADYENPAFYPHNRVPYLVDPQTGAQRIDSGQIDTQRVPPALWIVKDDGIYIVSNGMPKMPGEDPAHPSRMFVVYARGFDPDTDPDVHGAACAAAGGDDFAEPIEIDPDLLAFIADPQAGALVVQMSETRMAVEFWRKDRLRRFRGQEDSSAGPVPGR